MKISLFNVPHDVRFTFHAALFFHMRQTQQQIKRQRSEREKNSNNNPQAYIHTHDMQRLTAKNSEFKLKYRITYAFVCVFFSSSVPLERDSAAVVATTAVTAYWLVVLLLLLLLCCCHAIIGLFIGFFSVCVYLSFLFFSFNKKTKNKKKKRLLRLSGIYWYIYTVRIYNTRDRCEPMFSFFCYHNCTRTHTLTHRGIARESHIYTMHECLYHLLFSLLLTKNDFVRFFPLFFSSFLLLIKTVLTRECLNKVIILKFDRTFL